MDKHPLTRHAFPPLLVVALMAFPLHAVPVTATPSIPGCTGGVGNAADLATEVNSSNASATDDTITLVAGCTYKITSTFNVTDGTHKLTIIGNGATIDGQNMRRIFDVINGAGLILKNVTLTHGSGALAPHVGGAILNEKGTITIERSTISNNDGYFAGGAIFNGNQNKITVKDSTLSGNTALNDGGAVYNNGTIEFTNSTLSSNRCTSTGGGHGGGALFNNGISAGFTPTARITNSTLSNNVCPGANTPGCSCPGEPGGGAITNKGNVELIDSTLSGNSAENNGGAILHVGTQLLLVRTTVSGNMAGNDGGGIYSGTQPTPAHATVENSTVSGNTAGNNGGGIFSVSGSTLTNSTLASNSAGNDGSGIFVRPYGPVIADNTIVAGNSGGANCAGSSSPGGSKNLSDTPACGPNFLVGNPKLGPLASNGGLTMTHALLAGSGAINAGANNTCLATDQRGVARARASVDACDIGSYESPAGAPVGTITYYSGVGVKLPWGIAAGPDGALWFTNQSNNTIGRITTGGAISNYPAGSSGTGNSTPPRPYGITAGSDGGVWFVDPNDNTIGRIDPSSKIVDRFHGGGISTPFTIATGSDGNLWFPNGAPVNGGPGPSSIGRFNPISKHVDLYTASTIKQPWDIAAGSDGALWFTNKGNQGNTTNGSIGRIDPAAPATSITKHWSGLFNSPPSAITSGPDGAIWFSNGDNSTKSIMRIDPSTKAITRHTTVDTTHTYGMITGPDHAIWFTNWGASPGVHRFDPVSNSVTKYSTGPNSFPAGIAVGPDGAIWFTDYNFNRIGRIQLGPATTPSFSTSNPTVPVGLNCQASCANGGDPAQVVVDDFNGNGIMDMATANPTARTVSVRIGLGNGTFQNPIGGAATADIAIPGGATSLAAADLDNDGKTDLAVVGQVPQQPSALTILLGNGDGTFHFAATSSVGLDNNPVDVAASDIDGDDYVDLAVTNRDDHTISILINDADTAQRGTFSPEAELVVSAWADSVALADLDDDDEVDLVATQFNGGTANGVVVALGNGDGTFGPLTSFPAGQSPISVDVADVNGDTRMDLVVADWTLFCNSQTNPTCTSGEEGSVSALLGQLTPPGSVSYKPPTSYTAGFTPNWVGVADLDHDGLVDIANTNIGDNTIGGSVTIQRSFGLGGGLFTPAPAIPIGYFPVKSAIADLTCDGYADLLVPNGSPAPPDKVNVLLNTTPGSSALGCPFPPPPSICSTVGAIVGTPNADTLTGGNGPDVICGRGGKDTLIGKGGADILIGEGGADLIQGEGGTDSLYGEAGADDLRGGGDDDGLNGGAGVDLCDGGGGTSRFLLC